MQRIEYHPHEYQKYATNFIRTHPQAAILLGCGLGKTSITLTAIQDLLFDSFEVHKILIIAPIRVCRNSWAAELEKWEHLKNLTYSLIVGTRQQRENALTQQADIFIINRENVKWLVDNHSFDFDMVVIDELSSFKNPASERFKALRKVRPLVKRIVGLTGTPCSNGLIDLWAEFRLIDKGVRLGKRIGQYREQYFKPLQIYGTLAHTYLPKDGAEQQIYDKIADISISMQTTDFLNMPELISTCDTVTLEPDEMKMYQKMKRDFVLPYVTEEVTAANAAVLCGKLTQLASGCIYTDEKKALQIHGRKLDALEDLIEATNGKPILIAYWYAHEKERIQERLQKLVRNVRELKSDRDIRDWNAGKISAALIQPSSAGHGLNLQFGGSTLIWFTMPWSLELYQQTNARLWRQGQQSETVVIHHLVAKGTVDEEIMAALEVKDKTQSAMMNAVKAELGGVS